METNVHQDNLTLTANNPANKVESCPKVLNHVDFERPGIILIRTFNRTDLFDSDDSSFDSSSDDSSTLIRNPKYRDFMRQKASYRERFNEVGDFRSSFSGYYIDNTVDDASMSSLSCDDIDDIVGECDSTVSYCSVSTETDASDEKTEFKGVNCCWKLKV